MNTPTRSTLRRFLGNRTAVIAAGTAGFLLGAGGLVAAQHGADDAGSATPATETSTADTTVSTTADTTVNTTTDTTATSTATSTENTTASSAAVTPTSVDVSVPATIDDNSTGSLPGSDDANPVTSLPGSDDATSSTIDDSGDDDANTSTSVPDGDGATSTTIDDHGGDDDAPSTSVPVSLPGPFTETYRSSGGSISVTWSGTAFSINTISPAAGFAAEIEDNSWDRIRVGFEHETGDARIEVQLHEGQIRVRID